MQSFIELWSSMIDESQDRYFIIEYIDMPIGFCSIYNIDRKNLNAELGYYIAEEKYKGKKIGVKFMKILLKTAFIENRLNKVYVKTFSDNDINKKFLEKIGFSREGHFRQDKVYFEEFKDIDIYGLLKREFEFE